MDAASADLNEQNVVTVRTAAGTLVFKQIAGLLADVLFFPRRVGDTVERGERVGLIKFGSRTDVIFAADAVMKVRTGDRVKGGSSVLAIAQPRSVAPACTRRGGAMSQRPLQTDPDLTRQRGVRKGFISCLRCSPPATSRPVTTPYRRPSKAPPAIPGTSIRRPRHWICHRLRFL